MSASEIREIGAARRPRISFHSIRATGLTPAADLAANRFARVTNAADADNGSTITYVSSTGNLYYDSNGAADGGAALFATLATNLALTNIDFSVV